MLFQILDLLFKIPFLVRLAMLAPYFYLFLLISIIYGLFAKHVSSQFKKILTLLYFLYVVPGMMFFAAFGIMLFDAPHSVELWQPYMLYGILLFVTIILPGVGVIGVRQKELCRFN